MLRTGASALTTVDVPTFDAKLMNVAQSPSAQKIAVLLLIVAISSCVSSSDSSVGAETGYIEGRDDVRLFYRIAGSGADTVVVVHGGPGAGMDAVRLDFQPLTTGRTVIYYDQRGGGRSTLPPDTTLLEVSHHAADLEAVRQHFGLEQMNIVAHSFGSILVAEYAKLYADRLRRIVFIGATGPRRSSASALARSQFSDADSTLLREMHEPLSRLMNGRAEAPVDACKAYRAAGARLARSRGEEIPEARGSECLMGAPALSYYFKYTAQLGPASVGDWDYSTSLDSLSAPLLVIYGDRDRDALAVQREWTAAVDSARLFPVADAGKAVHVQSPDLVFEAIDAFFAERWPEGAE